MLLLIAIDVFAGHSYVSGVPKFARIMDVAHIDGLAWVGNIVHSQTIREVCHKEVIFGHGNGPCVSEDILIKGMAYAEWCGWT